MVIAATIGFSCSTIAGETEKPHAGRVSVAGEVKKPGFVQIGKKTMTLLDAIKMRGGPTAYASGILGVIRDGKKSNYDYGELKKEPARSPMLRAGDRIVVMHKSAKSSP